MTESVGAGRIWVVRAGEKAVFVDDFRNNNLVAIGWYEVGRLPDLDDDAALLRLFGASYPNEREGTLKVWIAQVRRFYREVAVGDPIATYDPNRRMYYIGHVDSDVLDRDHHLSRHRRVHWLGEVSRDALSVATRNGLGSIATFFKASPEASRELKEKLVPFGAKKPPVATPKPSEEQQEILLRAEIVEKSEQFIEDAISRLDWERMQHLVAGILRAMGYQTQVSAAGADRGVDIFASPDGLGLQEPRSFVEVKHRPGTTMSADEVRSFLGGRRPGDRCLYVSTGGFSKDARYEAERSNVPLTLVTLPKLRELLINYYERMDAEARSLVPLQRIYWPVQ